MKLDKLKRDLAYAREHFAIVENQPARYLHAAGLREQIIRLELIIAEMVAKQGSIK